MLACNDALSVNGIDRAIDLLYRGVLIPQDAASPATHEWASSDMMDS